MVVIPEIHHQPPPLRSQALGALPSPPRTDAIHPESYAEITAKIRSSDLRNPDVRLDLYWIVSSKTITLSP